MSEMVKALGMALGGNDPKKWGGKPPLATCTRCSEPLIPTCHWRRYEFVCVCCGTHLGFVEPTPVEETPENRARYEALQAEWDAAKESGQDLDAWLRERVEKKEAAEA